MDRPCTQILAGDFVFDLTPETAQLVMQERKTLVATGLDDNIIEFEDIYGAPCGVRADSIHAFRYSSPEIAAIYRGMHIGDDE